MACGRQHLQPYESRQHAGMVKCPVPLLEERHCRPEGRSQWDAANLARMRAGQPPQRFNPDKAGMESMELSHEPIPARAGGTNLVPGWPQDHAAVDPYRHPGP